MTRAQASLEYLSTYGWAFMAILVTLGALTYFGVFNADRYRNQDCDFASGLICDDYGWEESCVGTARCPALEVRNNFGVPIQLTALTGETDNGEIVDCSLPGAAMNLEDSHLAVCEFQDSTHYRAAHYYDFTLRATFNQVGSGYEHNITGFIQIKS